MRRLICFSLLFATCVLVGSAPALAEKRGVKVNGKDAADYVAEQIGQSYAVVIGIDDYQNPKVPDLKYAVADAKAVAATLEKRGYQVTALYDRQATQRAIVSELRSKLKKKVGKQDRVVIFYAGHGEEDKVEGGKQMGYLLPVDGELEDVPATGISMGVIKELADELPAKQVLFLVDVCYGGIAGQQTRGLPKMTEDYLRLITREKGRQLITAGGADQEALEAPEWGHSVFTYYLLEGLDKGLADLNNDGIIPTSELYTYLNERVFAAANMKGHKQKPELWALAPEKGEFVFFASASPSAGNAAISVPGSGLSDERKRLRAERDALQAERAKMEADKLAADKAALEAERTRMEAERQRLEADRKATEQAKQEAERLQLEQEQKKIEEARLRPFNLPLSSLVGRWKYAYIKNKEKPLQDFSDLAPGYSNFELRLATSDEFIFVELDSAGARGFANRENDFVNARLFGNQISGTNHYNGGLTHTCSPVIVPFSGEVLYGGKAMVFRWTLPYESKIQEGTDVFDPRGVQWYCRRGAVYREFYFIRQ
nr:caspase family protein [Nitrospirota bacterium]